VNGSPVGEKQSEISRVGVVIVKDGKILATGHRGESGDGNHGEYCALKKLNEADVQGATVYTTLEPCSKRKPPKISCAKRLIEWGNGGKCIADNLRTIEESGLER
jgi:pyrimidine deaminase RibD-like protein